MMSLVADGQLIYPITSALTKSIGIPRHGTLRFEGSGEKVPGKPKPFCHRLRTRKQDNPNQAASFAEVYQ